MPCTYLAYGLHGLTSGLLDAAPHPRPLLAQSLVRSERCLLPQPLGLSLVDK